MTAFERLIDGFGTGGQAALQGGQGKAHRALALAVCQRIRLLPFLFHVIRHGRVEGRLQVGQGIVRGVGAAFGKERRTVEGQEFFFTMRRMRSETSTVCTPSRGLP
jgi:hypothetical protein